MAACSREKGTQFDTLQTLKISTGDLREQINLSDFVTKTTLIQLETTPDCILGSVDKVEVCGDTLIILDKKVGQVVMFDRKGKYLSKIKKLGKGPGEYEDLKDLYIDSQHRIHLLSWSVVLTYQTDGTFLGQTKIPISGSHMMYLSDSLVVIKKIWSNYIEGVTGEEETRIAVTTANFSDFTYGLPFDLRNHDSGPITFAQVLTKSGESVFYTEPCNDTIFRITKDWIGPYLYVDFGTKKLPAEEYQLPRGELFFKVIQEGGIASSPHDYLETERYSFLSYFFEASRNFVVVDRVSGEVVQAKQVIDDFDDFIYVAPQAVLEGKLLSVLSPLDLVEHLGGGNSEVTVGSLTIREGDNPLLLLAEPKRR